MKKLFIIALSMLASVGHAATLTYGTSVHLFSELNWFESENGVPSNPLYINGEPYINLAGVEAPYEVAKIYRLNDQSLNDIQQFNPSLGTLNSVTIGLNGLTDSFYDAYAQQPDNIAPESAVSVSAEPAIAVALSVPRTGAANQLRAFSLDTGNISCSGFSNCLTSEEDFASISTIDQFFDTILLDTFIGTADLSDIDVVLYAGLASIDDDNTGFASIDIEADFFGLVDITYDYTPSAVPLPAAIWLFGSAITGFAGFSRLRRKR